MRLLRPLVAVAFALAPVVAPAATAVTNCFGPSSSYVCVHAYDASLGWYTECVYAGGTECQKVRVPTVLLDGRVGWSCHGDLACVEPGT